MAEAAIIGHHSDEHTWLATITGYANMILLPDSEYYAEFTVGEADIEIANIHISNDGGVADYLHVKAVEYPGVTGEAPLFDVVTPMEIPTHGTAWIHIRDGINAPTEPGKWPLGVKIWGDTTETEPEWGLAALAGMPRSLSDAHRWSAGIGLPKPEEIPWWAYVLATAGITAPVAIIVSDQLKK